MNSSNLLSALLSLGTLVAIVRHLRQQAIPPSKAAIIIHVAGIALLLLSAPGGVPREFSLLFHDAGRVATVMAILLYIGRVGGALAERRKGGGTAQVVQPVG